MLYDTEKRVAIVKKRIAEHRRRQARPFQRREVDDLIHDLRWYDFGDLDRNMRSIEIRSELISMLNARDRECEELGSN